MATATRVQVFDFDTAGEWTLADDAEITGGALTLTDPIFEIEWTDKFWSPLPGTDGNNDRVLAEDQVYYAMDGAESPSALFFADGMFVFWMKRTGDVGVGDTFHHLLRHDVLQDIKVRTQFYPDAVGNTRGRVVQHDGAVVVEDYKSGQDFTENIWREIFIRFMDDEVKLQVGALRSAEYRNITRTDAGTVGLRQDGANERWTLGGGSSGSKDAPFVAYRRHGACELKEAHAWTIPAGCSALGRVGIVAGTATWKGSGSDPGDTTSFDVDLQYRLKHAGAWGDWTDVPADGDLSGLSITANVDKLLIRVDNGSGYGLDNWIDPRYVPYVYRLFVTYTIWAPDYDWEDEMRQVLSNLKALLNDDATLGAYTGWGGAQVLWAELGEIRTEQQCGVLIVPDVSPEINDGRSMKDGVLTWVKHYTHQIDLYAWVRLDRDIEDEVLAEGGLLDLTTDVKDAMRRTTLSDTIHTLHIEETEMEAVISGIEPDVDVLPACRIRIIIESQIFEGS